MRFEQRVDAPPHAVAGLLCTSKLPKPPKGRSGSWRQQFVIPDSRLQVEVGASEEDAVLVPLIRPELHATVELQLVFRPKADLLGLAIGFLTIVPLPFMLAEMRDRRGPGAVLELAGAPPWRIEKRGLSVSCVPAGREAVEAKLAPHLARAATKLARGKPSEVDLDHPAIGVRSLDAFGVETAISRAAALVGWADPRVRELVARYDAVRSAYRTRVAELVNSTGSALPLGPQRIADVTLETAALDCTSRKRPRKYGAAESCVVRLRMRNDGPGALLVPFGVSAGQAYVFDGSGARYVASSWRPGSPREKRVPGILRQGERVEVVAELLNTRRGHTTTTGPVLLRVRLEGPVEVLGDGRPTELPRSEVSVELSSLENLAAEATLKRDESAETPSYRQRAPDFSLLSLCTGRRIGSLSSPFMATLASEKLTYRARLFEPVTACPEITKHPLGARETLHEAWQFVRLERTE